MRKLNDHSRILLTLDLYTKKRKIHGKSRKRIALVRRTIAGHIGKVSTLRCYRVYFKNGFTRLNIPLLVSLGIVRRSIRGLSDLITRTEFQYPDMVTVYDRMSDTDCRVPGIDQFRIEDRL